MVIEYYNSMIMTVIGLLLIVMSVKSRSGLLFCGGVLIVIFYAEEVFVLSFGPLSTCIRVLDVLGLIVCAAIFLWRRSRLEK